MITLDIRPSLAERAGDWDALIDDMERPSPFLRSWWLEAVAGAGTEFVLVMDGGRLIGGIPAAFDRRRGLKRCRLVGSGSLAPHNLDLVAQRGRERDLGSALEEYLGRARPGIVDIFGVDPDSTVAASVPAAARVATIDAAPRISVPTDLRTYIDSRARKLRQELRRVQRRLGEAGFEYREADRSQYERALTTFERLHRHRWGGNSHLLGTFDSLLSALRAGANRGEVAFQEVTAGSRVVACLVTIDVAGISSWYQMGRDLDPKWSNSGTYLKTKAVERSCRLGHSAIDMCIGDSRVKVAWSDSQRPVLRLRWGRGPLGRAGLAGLIAGGRLAEVCRARRSGSLQASLPQ